MGGDFKQGQRCLFTINNPESHGITVDLLKHAFGSITEVVFATWQLEKGESAGTLHFQGVVFFGKKVRANHVNKTYFKNKAKLKRCDSVEKAIEYVTKEETRQLGPWECGDRALVVESGSNKRQLLGIDTLADLVNSVNVEDYLPNYGNIRRYLMDRNLAQQRRWQTKFICLYGRSNTGKSTLAKQLWPNAFYIQKEHTTRNLWFDGYDGEEVMLVDDYHNTFSVSIFKELVNNTPHNLPVKGGKSQCWRNWSSCFLILLLMSGGRTSPRNIFLLFSAE